MDVDVKVLDIALSQPIAPDQLPAIIRKVTAAVPAAGREGIVLSGRLPVWVYGTLVHEYHPRPFVATFDPRLGGAVVVATHMPDVAIGQIIGVEDAEKITVEF